MYFMSYLEIDSLKVSHGSCKEMSIKYSNRMCCLLCICVKIKVPFTNTNVPVIERQALIG